LRIARKFSAVERKKLQKVKKTKNIPEVEPGTYAVVKASQPTRPPEQLYTVHIFLRVSVVARRGHTTVCSFFFRAYYIIIFFSADDSFQFKNNNPLAEFPHHPSDNAE
jgi:hypothetical protein